MHHSTAFNQTSSYNRKFLEFTFQDGEAHGFKHYDARIFLSLDTATIEWRDLLTRMDAEMWQCRASGEGDDDHEMHDQPTERVAAQDCGGT